MYCQVPESKLACHLIHAPATGKGERDLEDTSFPFQGSLGNYPHHSHFYWPELHHVASLAAGSLGNTALILRGHDLRASAKINKAGTHPAEQLTVHYRRNVILEK